MTTINLKDFYYWYLTDVLVEVPDEVAEELIASKRREAAHAERVRYNKAYYSLDCDDSGKNIERPDFQRLLQDIRLGLIKRVIVYKLDRISRSIVDFAKLMELFKQYDVEFVSCTEKFDTSTPMGRAMLNICIVFAQLERESIQMRVQDAFYSRCTKGYYMRGRTPYGFDALNL